jgi:histidyl-tRNA synthetase
MMANKVAPRLPAGMRDILPEQMLKRQYVLDVVRSVFEEFGFEPLQTPAIELTETVSGKYGEDAERLIYKAWYGDEPGSELSLRYDLSVPLSRVVAQYPDMPRPFKRYQIAPVWRADRPQKGRYREFYQCDADIVGTKSMLADAEIVTVIYQVLNRLGFTDFTISINNRKLLDGIGDYTGVPESLKAGLYRSIDKMDKIGLEGVRQELLMVGVPTEPREPLQRAARLAIQGKPEAADLRSYLIETAGFDVKLVDAVLGVMQTRVQEVIARNVPSGELQAETMRLVNELAPGLRSYYGEQSEIIPEEVVDRLLDLLQIQGQPQQVLADLSQRMAQYPRAMEGIQELRDLFAYLDALGVPENVYRLNFAMVRGLEYYTGPIFETTVEKPKAMPSITGGGRYDELIGLFTDVSSPATGTTLGIERIIDTMEELDMFPPEIRPTTAEVLVSVFSPETAQAALEVATLLRAAGINTSLYFEAGDSLRDQIGYASAKGIPYVVIIGTDEVASGQVTIRKLGATAKDSEQRTVARDQVANQIQNW